MEQQEDEEGLLESGSEIDSSRLGVLNTLAKNASKQRGGSKGGFGSRLELNMGSGGFAGEGTDSQELIESQDPM